MIKIQITATVFNPDTEETFSGWVDTSRPFELRTEHTDVPVYEFETADEASEFIEDFIGAREPAQDRGDYRIIYASETEQNIESGEHWHYAAMVEDPAYA